MDRLALCLVTFFLLGSVKALQLQNIHTDFLSFLGNQSSVWNHTDPVTSVQDQSCLYQLELFSKAYSDDEPWAVNFFDSWGKVPAGVHFGNVYEFGNFDQCRRVLHRHYYGTVAGQHCTLMVDVRGLNFAFGPIWFGLCMPAACRPALVSDLAGEFLRHENMRLVNNLEQFCYGPEEPHYSALAIAAIILFSGYGALLVLATAVEARFHFSSQTTPSYVKRCSIYNNLLKIYRTIPRNQTKTDTIDCINGIRSLSMLWIIVNHVHDTSLGIPASNGIMQTEYANSYFGVLFHRLGGKAVDIFLMLSGVLVTIKVLRELDRNRKLNVLKLWVHRIVRITPAYAATIFFAVAFTQYFGEGFLHKSITAENTDNCSKSWWSALLYVQNYVHQKNMCLAHTWYLSVDMQLYILSPLILVPLWKYGKGFVPFIVLLALLSISCVFTTFMVNDYRLNRLAPIGDGLMARKTYHATHARMSVWLFGVLFGYILHNTQSRVVRLSKTVQLLGWTITAAIIVATGYSLKQVYTGDYTAVPLVANAFYESLHRSLWAFAVMWIIFVCVNRQGGVVDEFLGWTGWQPMAKLSYTMYLLHIWLQAVTFTMQLKTTIYFSTMNLFYTIFGLTGLSMAAATVWSVAFEYPFFGAERILFGKSKSHV
ncbi:O-acyltransferase like protein-like [Sabethes cyaneus]|uniref:O-acyltransferase like protein-like n=1 Tax=Sabethes cyaneus TaxID=53552 RepID=UPI00237E22A6|nr:O-acyltransferase like protein-like [Sabethes cyaneus]